MEGENVAWGGPMRSTKLDISVLEPSFRIVFYHVSLRQAPKSSRMGSPRVLQREKYTNTQQNGHPPGSLACFWTHKRHKCLPKPFENGAKIENKSRKKFIKQSTPIFIGLRTDFYSLLKPKSNTYLMRIEGKSIIDLKMQNRQKH